MNNLNFSLHYYQKAILKKLTLSRGVRFNSLIIKGLESEHMNYHLKKLLAFGFVEKRKNLYFLTDQGKDYTNLLDDQVEIVEKQPKTSITIRGARKNPETGAVEHLVNKRLRHPYWGKVGRLTGKVRFGEKLVEAAARELYEETGLHAKTFVLEDVYHKIRTRDDGTLVQDVIFYILFVTGFYGEFIKKTEFQENFWLSQKDLRTRKDLDLYDDFDLDLRTEARSDLRFIESVAIAEGY